MVGFDGDESHGTIRKKITEKKQIQEIGNLFLKDLHCFFFNLPVRLPMAGNRISCSIAVLHWGLELPIQ